MPARVANVSDIFDGGDAADNRLDVRLKGVDLEMNIIANLQDFKCVDCRGAGAGINFCFDLAKSQLREANPLPPAEYLRVWFVLLWHPGRSAVNQFGRSLIENEGQSATLSSFCLWLVEAFGDSGDGLAVNVLVGDAY